METWRAGFETIETEYEPAEHNNMPFDEYCARHPIPHVEAADFLRGTIDNERIGTDLMSMHWRVMLLDKSDTLVLTSLPKTDRGIDAFADGRNAGGAGLPPG